MKALLKIAKFVCYLLSFPLFVVFAALASMSTIEAGGSYGFFAYLGVVVPAALCVIWFIIVLVSELKIKKTTKNKVKKIRKQTAKMVGATFALIAGLFVILDIALPPLLPGPTANTIFYEDLADDAESRSKLNKEMLDVIIARNVLNGVIGGQYFTYYKTNDTGSGPYTGPVVDRNGNTLVMCKYGYYCLYGTENNATPTYAAPAMKTDDEIVVMTNYFNNKIARYQAEGMQNEEVISIMDRSGKYNLFGSLNLSGYESWIGPWVDLANDGRMTIPVILNLIIGQRETVVSGETYGNVTYNEDGTAELQSTLQTYPWYNPLTKEVQMVQVGWTVLDMLGDYSTDYYNPASALGVDLSGVLGAGGIAGLLGGLEISGLPLGSLLESIIPGGVDGLMNNGINLLGLIQIPAINYLIDSLLGSVSAATGTPAVAGTPVLVEGDDTTGSGWMYGYAPLTLKLTNSDGTTMAIEGLSNVGANGNTLGIYSNNAARGVIDYQRMAWTDSNGLLFLICALLAIRKVAYIFSGVATVLMVIVGVIRIKLAKMEKVAGSAVVEATPDEQEDAYSQEAFAETEPDGEYVPYDNVYANPYDTDTTYYGTVGE